jgi:GH35 family endo-1,4-beta-xylanase
MKKVIYVEVFQVDDEGAMHNTYVCDTREEAEEILHAVVKRYKEVNEKDIANEDIMVEDEEKAFYAYHRTYFNNFYVLIVEKEKKEVNAIVGELEDNGFFI